MYAIIQSTKTRTMKTKELYYRNHSYYIKNKKVHNISMYDLEFYGSLDVIIKDTQDLMERVFDGEYYFFDGQKFIASLHKGGRYEIKVTEFVKYTPEQLETLGRL